MRRSIIFILFFYLSTAFASTYIKGPALIEDNTVTATAGATTTLTKDSQTNQIFTGTLNQTLVLPDATTIPEGRRFVILNKSSGVVTVQNAGLSTLKTLAASNGIEIRLTDNATADGVWYIQDALTAVSLTTDVVGVLPLLNGGTNKALTANNNSIVYSDTDSFELQGATSNSVLGWNNLSAVSNFSATTGQALRHNGTTLEFGLLDLANANTFTGLLPLSNGGSNKNLTASAGSVLYSDADSFELSAVGTAGQALLSNGTGAPSFGAIDISTAAITGVLPIANGGTNNSTTYTSGSLIFSNGTLLTQDNANLFWDDTNNRLGIGITTPSNALHISKSLSGAGVTAIVENTSATASSDAHLRLTTATGGGNAHIIYSRDAAQYWSNGIDTSSSDAFKVSSSINLGTNTRLWLTTGGQLSIGASAPATSAKLDIQGTDGALLIPRLTTVQKNALTATAGMTVYDTTLGRFECYTTTWATCGGARLVSSDLTLTASDTLAISTTSYNQTFRVQGDMVPVTLSVTPFGTSAPLDGYRITLIGNDADNSVTIVNNDAAKGCILNGDVTLNLYQSIMLEYNSALDRFIEISRSF